MSRTVRTTPTGAVARDGHTVRSERRPQLSTRRQGTRHAVVAAAVAEYFGGTR